MRPPPPPGPRNYLTEDSAPEQGYEGPAKSPSEPDFGDIPMGGAREALAKVPQYLAETRARAFEAEKQKQIKVSLKPNGLATVEDIDPDYLNTVLRDHKAQIETNRIYDQWMNEQIAEKQAQLKRSRGWPAALSTIAGALAANDPNRITRGLGQAALALNPTPASIEGDIAKLQQGRMQAAGQRTDSLAKMYQMQAASQKTATTAEVAKSKAKEAQKRLAQKAAQDRVLDEETLDAYDLLDDQEKGAYLAMSRRKQEVVTGDEARKATEKRSFSDYAEESRKRIIKTAADNTRNNRIRVLHEAHKLKTSQSMLDYETSKAQVLAGVNLELTKAKEAGILKQEDLNELQEAHHTDLYLDKIRDVFSDVKLKDASLPFFTYNPDAKNEQDVLTINYEALLPKNFQSGDRTAVISLLEHEKPRITRLIMGGRAGGVSLHTTKAGQETLAALGASKSLRPDQILHIEKIIRDTNNEVKAKVMRSKPDVFRGGEFDALLSVDTKHNESFFRKGQDSFGHKLQQPIYPLPPGRTAKWLTPSATRGGAPASGAAPGNAMPTRAEAEAMPEGGEINVGGKRYRKAGQQFVRVK